MPPTSFQKKMLWAAITAMSFALIAAGIALVGWLLIGAISYLQPVLIPIAIAAILAYLLDPLVQWLEKCRIRRTFAVIIVFLMVLGAGAGVVLGVLPTAFDQGRIFRNNLPTYTQSVHDFIKRSSDRFQHLMDLPIFHKPTDPTEPVDPVTNYISTTMDSGVAWLTAKAPDILTSGGHFVERSVGGFLGVAGFIVSLILVPIFLFFFLKEGRAISNNWSNYLPLRASPLKSEIVSLFTEINNYLINFFRGQLIVSLIDGLLVFLSLMIFVRLEFSLVIGLMVGILGLIPYAGVLISWIPAVIIAALQFQDWWHPVLVTIIFLAVNQLEGLLISPKIVGQSVGLHPLTVIISVLAWSLILGGLLGALLAIPLTATLKVLLKRYFWDRPSSRDTEANMKHST